MEGKRPIWRPADPSQAIPTRTERRRAHPSIPERAGYKRAEERGYRQSDRSDASDLEPLPDQRPNSSCHGESLPDCPGAQPLALPMFLTNPDVPGESYSPEP